jgi:hypothetical protein
MFMLSLKGIWFLNVVEYMIKYTELFVINDRDKVTLRQNLTP